MDHDYIVGYKVTTITKSEYKYETPFKGPYGIFQAWTNVTLILRMVAVTTRINIHNIKPYNNTNVE